MRAFEPLASRVTNFASFFFLCSISITGTFKHQKVELRNEGMNPRTIKDPLFVYDFGLKKYTKFTTSQHDAIVSQKSRL